LLAIGRLRAIYNITCKCKYRIVTLRSGIDEDLGGGAEAEAELLAPLQAEPDGVRGLVARGDPQAAARLQAATFEEEEEVAALVPHPRYLDRGVERAGEEVGEDRLVDLAMGVGDGVAVRVDRGVAEHLVHALDQPVGDGVLQELGLGVHL